ncbi:MAG TPA: Ig-like domain-containing protein, partial [Galbitalea sp.]
PGVLDVNVLAPTASPIPATPEPDVVRTFVGQQVTISPLANDIAGADPSNPQARLALSGTIASPAGATVTTDAAAGSVTFVATQPGTYTLAYQAAFGSAKTATGQIRVDVETRPTTLSGPVAMPDVAVLQGQQPATVDVLANDSDPSGALLTVESAAPVDAQSGLQVSVVQGRWLRIVATKPSIGGPRIVNYEVTDGTSPAVTGDVAVTQLPAATTDVPPIAEDDAAVVRAGDVVSVNVLANDTDPNGGPLSLVQGVLPSRPQLGGAYASGSVVRYAAPATVPTATFVVVDYIVQNSNGDSATGHVDITVNPVDGPHDSPPQPASLEARVAAGGTVTINVPIYNVDPDGDSVTVTGIPTAPKLGQVVSLARDSITYQAYAQSAGTDAFQYQAQDRFGQFGTAQVRVAIVPAGAPQSPVAVDDVLTSAPGANLHIDVLANDLIAPGDDVTVEPLARTNTVIPVGASLEGTVLLVKAPDDGAAPLVLSYGITDGTGAVSVAQVTVRAKAGFDIPPIARDDTVSPVPATGSTVTVAVTANDDDPQGSRADLQVTKVFDPLVVISGSSLVIPIETYAQTIGYQISDPAGSEAMAVVNVPGRLTAAGPPKLKPDVQPIAIPQGGQKTIVLADYVLDPRGRSVRLTTADKISGSPADALQGQSQNGTTLVLHSVGTYSGPAAITFEVTDGTNLSDPTGVKAVLTIPVTIGSAPPTLKCPATPLSVTAGGSPLTVDLTSLCQAVVSGPTQLASLKFSSTLSALPGVKLTSSGSAGEQLQLTAAADAKPKATGTITVQIAG